MKPCPFCKSERVVVIGRDVGQRLVDCHGCGVVVDLALWNNRPIEDSMQQVVDTALCWLENDGDKSDLEKAMASALDNYERSR